MTTRVFMDPNLRFEVMAAVLILWKLQHLSLVSDAIVTSNGPLRLQAQNILDTSIQRSGTKALPDSAAGT